MPGIVNVTRHRQHCLRPRLVGAGIGLAVLVLGMGEAEAVKVRNYYSPLSLKRPIRDATELVILHTTEGSEAGSLRKLHENGEAHYLVTQSGGIYALVHRNRVAYHAGVSMWKGRTHLDRRSIGIEVVGYHNGRLTALQVESLRWLLADLKKAYRLPDGSVLTHSMVAYGEPNRWHRRPHRGRKRCGMVIAHPETRRRLGIAGWPAYDPDVRARRLVDADPYLTAVLYGPWRGVGGSGLGRGLPVDPMVVTSTTSPWDIARGAYDQPTTLYRFPDGTEVAGNEVQDWKRVPPGTKVILNVVPAAAPAAMGPPAGGGRVAPAPVAAPLGGGDKDNNFYVMEDGQVRAGKAMTADEVARLPAGTRILPGYIDGGMIVAGRSAFDICGVDWNAPTTLYRLPDGSLRTGSVINARTIPPGTQVFFQSRQAP